MPPKRKASSSVRGSTKANRRGSVASTPGPATPRSIGSSDEFTENDLEQVPKDTYTKILSQKFDIQNYVSKEAGGANRTDSASHHFGEMDFSGLSLKPDHDSRPLWIDPNNGKIILESFSPLAAQAQDFLTTVAEPKSRPTFVHEYMLTPHSLYAAVAVGLDRSDIINVLERLSKTPVTDTIKRFITNCTQNYGKVKLVLRHTKHFIESSDPETLQRLLRDEVIGPLRVQGTEEITTTAAPKMGGLVIPGTKDAAGVQQALDPNAKGKRPEEGENANQEDILAILNEDDDDDDVEAVHSFQIVENGVEQVRKRCLDILLPSLEEYDFRNDTINTDLEIELKPTAQIRSYQEKSLSKMFGNGRAKSGIIVLPCGAGKTLVGITAACTIRKGVVILATNNMAALQWRQEFLKWSNINPDDIAVFTAADKNPFKGNTGILISTYPMVSQTRTRAHDSAKMMDFLTSREWGFMILDEVHVCPASVFRAATSKIKAHTKLGLTATLLREDDKINDLNWMIGPKLYEANWMELAEQGHIAKVQCAEVWCPMTTEFYSEYQKATERDKQDLFTMNPHKFQACQFLIDYHKKRGDKIIIFSDNIYSLRTYAMKLGHPMIHGGTSQQERVQVLENFQLHPDISALFLSKIGDTSLDLPEATCLIQISAHYGSRRQEAQRLGRILRAKRRNDEGFNAFFYSLVSKDTREMYYSAKRQAFLVDQGYAFKVITHLQGIENLPGLAFNTPAERRELLADLLVHLEKKRNGKELDEEVDELDTYHIVDKLRAKTKQKKAGVQRTAGMLSELAGGQDMAYVEQNKSKNKELKKAGKKVESNPWFKKMERQKERKKKAQEALPK